MFCAARSARGSGALLDIILQSMCDQLRPRSEDLGGRMTWCCECAVPDGVLIPHPFEVRGSGP